MGGVETGDVASKISQQLGRESLCLCVCVFFLGGGEEGDSCGNNTQSKTVKFYL